MQNSVQSYIESRGGFLISKNTKGHGEFIWLCENGHQNKSGRQIAYRKSWCKQCIVAKTKTDVLNNLEKKQYKLISYSSKKCEVLCVFGHKWTTSAHHIIEGNSCGQCNKERLKKGINRLSADEANDRLKKHGIELIDSKFVSVLHKHKLKCENGHYFEMPIKHLITGLSGCPNCNNFFKSEKNFRALVEQIFDKPFPKSRPSWLKNPKTGYHLELDCYNESLGLAFEYDGQFHFEVRKGLNNDLKKTKHLDSIKNKLCKKNGVRLVRIPFFMKKEEMIYSIIRELDAGVPCPVEVKQARAEARGKVIR
jgi:hypothetical protein